MIVPRTLIVLIALPLALAACHKADSAVGAATPGAALAAIAPPAGQAWADVVSATPEGGMRMGNPNAPIKLVEYGSLSCPHCAHFSGEAMKPLTAKYVNSGKVSYEYRSFAIHSVDVPLTVLVRCAPPSAFFGLVEQLYAGQEALMTRMQTGEKAAQAAMQLGPQQRFIGVADALGLTDFFSARGIAVDQAHSCLSNIASAEAVAKQSQAISDSGIDSTPTLIINGTKSKALSWAELEPELQAAGAR